mmetsp:Transcript_60901/g.135700  ORF Transcript_60901/g.135700 Transcript_60901/m.135700 type:complete len:259 (-) Transcript_60901:405-1181(-)
MKFPCWPPQYCQLFLGSGAPYTPLPSIVPCAAGSVPLSPSEWMLPMLLEALPWNRNRSQSCPKANGCSWPSGGSINSLRVLCGANFSRSVGLSILVAEPNLIFSLGSVDPGVDCRAAKKASSFFGVSRPRARAAQLPTASADFLSAVAAAAATASFLALGFRSSIFWFTAKHFICKVPNLFFALSSFSCSFSMSFFCLTLFSASSLSSLAMISDHPFSHLALDLSYVATSLPALRRPDFSSFILSWSLFFSCLRFSSF